MTFELWFFQEFQQINYVLDFGMIDSTAVFDLLLRYVIPTVQERGHQRRMKTCLLMTPVMQSLMELSKS